MDRRSVLRFLGVATVGATATDLEAMGRALHGRLGRGTPLRILDPHQNATVVALSDVILPATDTPGAKAALVNQFIDLLLAEWFSPEERDRVLAGLANVDARAKAAFGKDFLDGTPTEQVALLTALDDETARWNASPQATRGPEPFYHQLKWLTLFGYYTSEVGAEQEEHYAIIPGRYVPCAPADTVAAPE